MKYLVKKDNLYLYKIKDNGFAYFSSKEKSMTFSKRKAIDLAKQYGGEVEVL